MLILENRDCVIDCGYPRPTLSTPPLIAPPDAPLNAALQLNLLVLDERLTVKDHLLLAPHCPRENDSV